MRLLWDCFNEGYHFNLVPRMGLAESLWLDHQAPNLAQIRKSEI